MKIRTVTNEFNGDDLKRLAINFGDDKYKCRDFVSAINEYCNNCDDRVMVINGLAGTGKTIGMLQSIYKFGLYNESVYISIDSMSIMNCLDLQSLIESNYLDKKYIFIDEITRVKDFTDSSKFLYDAFSSKGYKVIISGDYSLKLLIAEDNGLKDKVNRVDTTFISYNESEEVFGESSYIRFGGLPDTCKIKSIYDVKTYINLAVIENAVKSTGISTRKLRFLVFRILYMTVYCNIHNISVTNALQLVEMQGNNKLKDRVRSQMLINKNMKFTEDDAEYALDLLSRLDIVVKIHNLFNEQEFKCYIINPSIEYQILESIRSIYQEISKDMYKDSLYRNIIAIHANDKAKKSDRQLFYYEDDIGRELDAVIRGKMVKNDCNKSIEYEVITLNNSCKDAKDILHNLSKCGVILDEKVVYTKKL